jgi:hypothetical protein
VRFDKDGYCNQMKVEVMDEHCYVQLNAYFNQYRYDKYKQTAKVYLGEYA